MDNHLLELVGKHFVMSWDKHQAAVKDSSDMVLQLVAEDKLKKIHNMSVVVSLSCQHTHNNLTLSRHLLLRIPSSSS